MRHKFGDCFSSLRHGVLGEFPRNQEPSGSLDFIGLESGLIVDHGETSGLASKTVENVVADGIHD